MKGTAVALIQTLAITIAIDIVPKHPESNICPDNEFANIGCAPEPNICEIHCKKESGTKCNRVDQTSCNKAQVTAPPLEMGKEKCKELCQLSKNENTTVEDHCRFWRYEEDPHEKEQICSLMNDNQCNEYETCQGDSCKMGDEGCMGGEDPTQSCKGPIMFHTERIHWACFHTSEDIPSPYKNDTKELPPGTKCTPVQKCIDWDSGVYDNSTDNWRKLEVSCNGSNGTWEKVPGADGEVDDYEEVLPNNGTGAIFEHVCQGGNTKLDVPKANLGEGSDLLCENPDTDDNPDAYTINAPNSCALLCDLHLGMSIESSLNSDGEFDFMRDGDEKITDGNLV